MRQRQVRIALETLYFFEKYAILFFRKTGAGRCPIPEDNLSQTGRAA